MEHTIWDADRIHESVGFLASSVTAVCIFFSAEPKRSTFESKSITEIVFINVCMMARAQTHPYMLQTLDEIYLPECWKEIAHFVAFHCHEIKQLLPMCSATCALLTKCPINHRRGNRFFVQLIQFTHTRTSQTLRWASSKHTPLKAKFIKNLVRITSCLIFYMCISRFVSHRTGRCMLTKRLRK